MEIRLLPPPGYLAIEMGHIGYCTVSTLAARRAMGSTCHEDANRADDERYSRGGASHIAQYREVNSTTSTAGHPVHAR